MASSSLIGQPSLAYVCSENRQRGESCSYFTNTYQYSIRDAKKIVVSKVSLAYLVYPFKSSNNTIQLLNEADTTYTLTIATDRFFDDGSDFSDYLNTLLSDASSTITTSFSADTYRLTFTGGSGDDATFSFGATTHNVLEKLGFGSNTDNTTLAATHAATSIINLSATTGIFLCSSALASGDTIMPFGGLYQERGNSGATGLRNVVSYIPVTVNIGDILTTQISDSNISVYGRDGALNDIDIALYDDDYEILNLMSNAKVIVEIHLQY